MANPSMKMTLKSKTVAFAVLTGKGRKGKKEENEYTMAVEVTPKKKNAIIDDLTEFFNDNKHPKTQKPKYSFDDLFTVSKTDTKNFVFWGSESVSSGIAYKVATGKGFTIKHFETMGQGSLIDVEYNVFYYNNSYGEGLGLRLSGVKLIEFIKYTKGGGTLDGDTLEVDGTQTESAAEQDEADDLVEEFNEAIEDRDWEEAEDILEDLEDHPEYKTFKKKLKKAKKA